MRWTWIEIPMIGFTDAWYYPLDPKGRRFMSIEVTNTLMGILFVGIWLLVGHIMTIDHP
jgi:hypothetical protein